MVFVYILKLEGEKYYIGKTTENEITVEYHNKCDICDWTRKYKPVNIEEIIDNCDDYDDDKYTKKYMDKYGVENVRGGSFSKEVLDDQTIKMLKKKRIGPKSKCTLCGIDGYFELECEKCEALEEVDKCLKMIEMFINVKKNQENIDPDLETNAVNYSEKDDGTIDAAEKFLENQYLYMKEKERVVEQKQRNTEFLPVIELMYKTLCILSNKIKNNPTQNNNNDDDDDEDSELMVQTVKVVSGQYGINLSENTIKSIFGGW